MTTVTGPGHHANGTPDGALPPVPSIPLTEETARGVAEEQSVGGLVRDAMTHISTLLRAEIELAKLEVVAEAKKGLRGGVYFLVALAILLFSLFFLFMMVANFFSEGLADLGMLRSFSYLLGYFVTFLLMLGGAGLAGLMGYRKVRGIKAPERTIESMKDTAAALRHPGER
ncbi:hypothetical protein BC739_008555 [Kutzneria viridogrisea]|uniref:Superfamily III holin-X n=2 Tax=Kutzneria TaxID=43356 RepID=A0ABR6BWM6_9PSEU|nr:phage holin family protein [Kutzneria albida]AHH93688.1 putative membrane protein [Kutzneria albida DSM 43870]MBA8931308.1 hypothetical protein [Kutzneria viridogrisea]